MSPLVLPWSMAGARPSRPDFLIIGAPKAGSTALHDALASHPQLYASPVKEPKYFLTGDRRPDRATHRGPGDAHSAREWVWRRAEYERLFAAAPAGSLRYEPRAHRRPAARRETDRDRP